MMDKQYDQFRPWLLKCPIHGDEYICACTVEKEEGCEPYLTYQRREWDKLIENYQKKYTKYYAEITKEILQKKISELKGKTTMDKKIDWDKVDAIPEDSYDYDEAPELTEEALTNAKVRLKKNIKNWY